jgi:acyl-CoA synthetase (AMP-forming)/AMP-acid ligase II
MPLNTRFQATEIEGLLEHVGHRGLVTLAEYNTLIEDLELADVEHVVVGGESLPQLDGVQTEPFDAVVSDADSDFETVPRKNSDHAFYMHTSGTTGLPKPVIATHENVRAHALGYLDRVELSRDDIALNTIPIFHVGGLNLHLTLFTQLGAPQVLINGWDTEKTLSAIETHDVSYMFLIATMLYDLANYDEPEQYDTESLEIVGAGGQNVPPPISRRFEERYDANVLEGYGLTETMPAIISNTLDDRRLGTAGKTIENVADIRIVDPDDWTQERAPGELGELLAAGDVVTPGYLNRPDANEETFEVDETGTRWLRTGDIVQRDEDGYISIEDRVDHMIISGGENVYPNEIEEVLYDIPGVSEAVVVGEPDDRFGERVVAVVVAEGSLTEESIIDYFKQETPLADYKRPRRVIFTDEIPRAGAGKIDRLRVEEELL